MTTVLQRRDAAPEDAAVIIGWFPTRREAVRWGGPTTPDPLAADWLIQHFASATYWAWTDAKGEVQAVAGLTPQEGGPVVLNRFAIAPAMRGKGLAASLVREVMDIARSRGDSAMSLWVYGSNTIARRVYDELGFNVAGQRVAEEDASGVSFRMQRDL